MLRKHVCGYPAVIFPGSLFRRLPGCHGVRPKVSMAGAHSQKARYNDCDTETPVGVVVAGAVARGRRRHLLFVEFDAV